MNSLQTLLMLSIFFATVFMMLWRPRNINEAITTSVAASVIFLLGIVPLADIGNIFGIVSGAAITILSTIAMSIVLESIGFFRWAAINLAIKANGSGIMLFWYINLLCFLMTLFFNNDGSILITTPIIIQTLNLLRLESRQKIPYLISGALVATGSSAPIGVSNLANLIALHIVKLDLNTYASMIFVPAMLGIVCMAILLFFYFKKVIPVQIPTDIAHANKSYDGQASIDFKLFRICLMIVIATRISFFALAPFGVPTEWPAVIGATLLILIRWYKRKIGAIDVINKSPWHILVFAFSMYVIVFGLQNVGMTDLIIKHFSSLAREGPLNAILIMGMLLTVLSNICNNLPSIMIGTLSITEMGLDIPSMQVAYLGNVIGADIGSLILPIGTLASLIWMHTLSRYQVPISWGEYLKVTIVVIPISLVASLLGLYAWTELFFF